MIRNLYVIIGIVLLLSVNIFAAEKSQDVVPRFDIQRYEVEGNTLIDADELISILTPYTGTARDFGTVQEAIDALEEAYRDHGYATVVVTLPEQGIENGIIRLRVNESRLSTITVEGNQYFDEANILRSIPDLHQGETPRINAISRSLALANANPAKKINVQFVNSDKENEIDAKIEVKDESPWKVGIFGDNSGDEQTGHSRLGLLFEHANVFNMDHLITLQFITSPEQIQDTDIYSIGYRIPFYSLGSSLDLIGAYSNVDSGKVSVASYNVDVSGEGMVFGMHYNQNLTRIGNYEHKVTLAVDYRAYENDVDYQGTQLGNDVTVHPLSLTYAGTLSMNKISGGFYLTDLQNLPGSWDGRGDEEDFNNARYEASDHYNIFRYGANVTYALGNDLQTRLLVNGQYTNDALVPGEQYGIGGAGSVRGFHEREIVNDQGYSASAEIYTPNLCRMAGVTAFQTRLLLFYDRGEVSRTDPLPDEVGSTEIASMGPGLRITDGKTFSVSVDVGFVVDPPDDHTKRGSEFWHVQGSLIF